MDLEEIIVFGDGGSRGNPGPSASAFCIFDSKMSLVHKEGFYLGITTNNVAEYTSVIKALEWISLNIPNLKSIKFFMDSELVVKQLIGKYKIKSPHLIPLSMKVKDLEKNIGIKIFFDNLPREKNTIADELVNTVLDEQSNN